MSTFVEVIQDTQDFGTPPTFVRRGLLKIGSDVLLAMQYAVGTSFVKWVVEPNDDVDPNLDLNEETVPRLFPKGFQTSVKRTPIREVSPLPDGGVRIVFGEMHQRNWHWVELAPQFIKLHGTE